MAQPDTARQALLNSLTDLYDPARHRVVVVTDANHFQMDPGTDFVADLARQLNSKGITAVGFETISAHDQQLFDALADKRITRDDYRQILHDYKSTGQVNNAEISHLYETAADLIDQGVRVYGLNTHQYAPQDPALEAAHQQYRADLMELRVDFMAHVRADNIFTAEAAAQAFKHMAEQNEYGNAAHLSPRQQQDMQQLLSEVAQNGSDVNLMRRYPDLFAIQHTAYDQFVDGREHLKSAQANPSEDSYFTARFSADEKLAEHVEGILKHEKGLLVQYGVAHTLQDNNLVPRDAGKQDMDGALRSKGIGVLVIDAYHGQQSINCTPLMTEEICAATPDIMAAWQSSAMSSNDPDRYVVPDVKGSEVKPVRPQPPAGP
jgi:hypothetical protein